MTGSKTNCVREQIACTCKNNCVKVNSIVCGYINLYEFCFIIICNKLYLVVFEVMCDGRLYGSRCCIKARVLLVLCTRGGRGL